MDNLSYEGMKTDLELRKKLKILCELRDKLQEQLRDLENWSPQEELDLRNTLQKVNETIGKIRFHSLDDEGIISDRNIKPNKKDEEGQDFNSTQSGDVKKSSESHGIGSFSGPAGITSELGNQVGQVEKVNAVEEVRKRNSVEQNKENAFEKGFSPEEPDDVFYKSLDTILGIDVDTKSHDLIGPEHTLPRGSKKMANDSERELYRGLRKTVNTWFEDVQKDTNAQHALEVLKAELIKWADDSKADSAGTIQKLYDLGLEAGVRKGKLKEKSIRTMVNKANGIGPAIDNFRDSCLRNITSIMKQHVHDGEHALYREKRHIDSWLRKQRYQTRLMVKTEVAKIANFGLVEGWGDDTNKYMYNYFWNTVEDDRTKEISRLRKSYNPLTYDEVAFLWKNQEQLMPNGKFMGDQWNQRCSISRQEINKEFTGNRFIGHEGEFRRTM